MESALTMTSSLHHVTAVGNTNNINIGLWTPDQNHSQQLGRSRRSSIRNQWTAQRKSKEEEEENIHYQHQGYRFINWVIFRELRSRNVAPSLKRSLTVGNKWVNQTYLREKTKVNSKNTTQTVCCKHPSQFTDLLLASTLLLATFQMCSLWLLPPNKMV